MKITAWKLYTKWILKMKIQTLTVTSTCLHLAAELSVQAAVIIYQLIMIMHQYVVVIMYQLIMIMYQYVVAIMYQRVAVDVELIAKFAINITCAFITDTLATFAISTSVRTT